MSFSLRTRFQFLTLLIVLGVTSSPALADPICREAELDHHCGDVPEVGRCVGHTLEICVGGQVETVDCLDSGLLCGFGEDLPGGGMFTCVEHDSVAAKGVVCADIPDSGLCVGNTVYWCDYASGRVESWNCSLDGTTCGWTGEYYCCHEPEHCVPLCQGRSCGDDGCGGTCGRCSDGDICTENGECLSCDDRREPETSEEPDDKP